VAQLFSLGHEILLRFFVSQIVRRRFSAVRFSVRLAADIFGRRTARADLSAAGKCGSLSEVRRRLFTDMFMKIHETWPNKSLEPTPVTPSVCREGFRLAVVIRPAWLSFFR